MPPKVKIVTAALPYANGSIHLGHLVEYIQADIYVRFQKLTGVKCHYFCADDTHGAPIMIRAKNEKVTPETIIERYQKEHLKDFTDFHIEFDNYHSTNSSENKALSEEIFLKLKAGGHISTREVEQTYCENDKMFLPDRFVRGVCPKCGATDQYGDACEACGSHYDTTDLKDPRCANCGTAPTRRKSDHYFFRVADYIDTLEEYLKSDALQPEVKNFLKTWLKEGLKEWDISRDGPYFGFKIPGEDNKYFYVWLDAPIGYISSTKNWADRANEDFNAIWKNGDAEIEHFIGKDIIYFHTLFWIPMLKGSGFKLPSKIRVHGFLTINGEKMSKTKGTFINARTYLNHLDPELLRYYYASKLKNSVADLDLNFNDFLFRVNAELVNKIANLGSRTITILNKNKMLDNRLGIVAQSEKDLLAKMQDEAVTLAGHYNNCDFSLAIKKISQIADTANAFIDSSAPWALKDDPKRLGEILSAGINAFRLISLYLKPVVPAFTEKVERILNINPLSWDDSKTLLENHTIGKFERLAERIDLKPIEKILGEASGSARPSKPKKEIKGTSSMIEFDDFSKMDLRTARVISAGKIVKADKLLKLRVDVAGEERTIVAGIAKDYTPEDMIGKLVVIVANLSPRKLMGIESQGMILAVNDGKKLSLVTSDGDVASGLRIS